MKDFISDHKRLSIGVVLYISVFIVSKFVSPWQIADLTINDFDSNMSNMVMDKLPVNIIFFGIYELCELLFYSTESGEMGSDENAMVFFVAACAFFTYTHLIRRLFINEDIDDFPPEKITLDFIYDNIFAYISSLLVFYLYMPVSELVINIFTGGNMFLIVVITLLLIFLILIPAIPQILQLLTYIAAIYGITKLINFMNASLEWNIILKTVLIFAVAIILIVITNIIVNVFIEILESKVREFLVCLVTEAFPSFITFLIMVVKFIIKATIVIAVLMLIAFIATEIVS